VGHDEEFFALLHHEIKLHLRQASDSAALLLFFIIVIVLMPFALGPEPEILRRLAPGLIWLAALLMSLLSLDRLFVQDARDGTLDIWLTTPTPLPLLVLAKILAHSVLILSALTLNDVSSGASVGHGRRAIAGVAAQFCFGCPLPSVSWRHGRGNNRGLTTQSGLVDLVADTLLHSGADLRGFGLRCGRRTNLARIEFVVAGRDTCAGSTQRSFRHRRCPAQRTRIGS